MARRPSVVPVWATNAPAGRLIEPIALRRQEGFEKDRRPPAPWVNWQFHHLGNWVDFLRGPNASQWTRVAKPGGLTGTLDKIAGDNATANDDHMLHRFVALDDTGTQQIWASVDGLEWVQRGLVGLAVGEFPNCICLSASRWVIGTSSGTLVGKIWTTRPDGYSPPTYATLSAIYDDTNAWVASTIPAVGATAVNRLASGQSTYTVAVVSAPVAANRLWVSALNATAFAVATLSVAPVGQFVDAVWTGTAWVAVTTSGEIYRTTDASAVWTKLGSSFAAGGYFLEADGEGVVLAMPRAVAAGATFYVSTDHGATWAAVAGPANTGYFYRVRFLDGQWFLVSYLRAVGGPVESGFPLHCSVDPTDPSSWVKLPIPYSDTGFQGLQDIAYAAGGLVAVGVNFEIVSARAQDLSPIPYAGGTPIQLHDAAYLQGVLVDDAAPADGQCLVYDAATSRYTLRPYGETFFFGAGSAGANFPLGEYLFPGGDQGTAATLTTDFGVYVPDAGVIEHLRLDVRLTGNTDVVTATVRVNGIASTITCATAGGAAGAHQGATDSTHSVTVAAGDFVSVRIIGPNATAHQHVQASIRYRRS